MNLTRWLLPLLWTGPAMGQVFEDPVGDMMDGGPAVVFVSPFQPRNAAAAGLAGMMSAFLESQLESHPELSVVPVYDAPPVHDMNAELYLESCPPGQAIGCAFVVGEVAGAEYAVTGTIQSDTDGTLVEVTIIDVRSSREAMSFVAQLGLGEDERFAEGVASVLVAVVRGEAGRVEDIRDLSETPEVDYSAAASQLSALASELGDVRTSTTRSGVVIDRPEMTEADLSAEMTREGSKPWERLGLSPQKYMQWKNSGEPLDEWSARNAGRHRQLVLRSGIGFGRGPVDGRYDGSYVREVVDSEFTLAEMYAWQSQEGGTGIFGDASLTYGLSPVFEFGVKAGFASGRYRVNVLSKVINNTAAPPKENDFSNSNLYAGPTFLAAFAPGANLRPVAGGSLLYWTGEGVDENETLPPELETFPGPTFFVVELMGGAEFRLSKNIDFYAHVPVTAVVAGSDTAVAHTGQGCREEVEGGGSQRCLDTASNQPPGVSPVGAGVMFGLQVRLFGRRQ
jgi:hypothetical protein